MPQKGLFQDIYPEDSADSRIHELGTWLRRNKSTFPTAVSLSLILHTGILLLMISPLSSIVSKKFSPQIDDRVFTQSMKRVEKDLSGLDRAGGVSPSPVRIQVDSRLKDMKVQSGDMSEDEAVKAYSDILASYIDATGGTEGPDPELRISKEDMVAFLKKTPELKSGDKAFLSESFPGSSEISLNILDKEKRDQLDRYFKRMDVVKKDFMIEGQQVKVQTNEGPKFVPAEYFFRSPPYEALLAHRSNLFYIKTGFPFLGLKGQDPEPAAGEQSAGGAEKKVEMFHVFLMEKDPTPDVTAAVSDSGSATAPALDPEGHEGYTQFLDDLMPFPENDQFLKFSDKYLSGEGHNTAAAHQYTKEFLRKNLNSVIFYISDITSAFDHLEEVYFNKALDGQFVGYVMRFPTSSESVEFLLALASHYALERKALMYLEKASGEARESLTKKMYRVEVFDKKAKCYVIKEVYEDLKKSLERLGYRDISSAIKKYTEEELKIYNHLIRKGGEARNIGLFVLGTYHWKNKDYARALEKWAEIDEDFESDILDEIRGVLSEYTHEKTIIILVDSIIKFYANRDAEKLLVRLTRFGKWKSRMK